VVFGIATLLLVGAYLFIVDKDKILIKTKSLINLSGAKKWHQS
jgi:hypothetical protein